MSGQLPWYVARAAGLMAWALLTASVVWGLAISTKAKAFGRRPKPAWTLDLHRFLGGLATIFTAVHVGAILVDTYVKFDLVSVLVPFAASWRPAAVAWGVASLYLLLAVELTSLAKARIPRRWWRSIHFASFPLFVMATIHLLTPGAQVSFGTARESWDDTVSMDRAYPREHLLKSAGRAGAKNCGRRLSSPPA